MIDDENDPRMIRAHQNLVQKLGTVLGDGRQTLTKPLLDRMFDVIKDHRSACRKDGLDFPVLVALVVPRLGVIEFVRADLELSSIRTKIVNFVRFNPQATMEEVVLAFRTAFPDLRPDDVMIGHKAATEAAERQEARIKKTLAEAGLSDPSAIEAPKEDGEGE